MTTPAQANKSKKPRVEVGLDEVRGALGGFVNRAGIGDERVVLTRHDLPVAAIVSIDDLKALEERDAA